MDCGCMRAAQGTAVHRDPTIAKVDRGDITQGGRCSLLHGSHGRRHEERRCRRRCRQALP